MATHTYIIEYHANRLRYIVYQLDAGFEVEIARSLGIRAAIRRAWLHSLGY